MSDSPQYGEYYEETVPVSELSVDPRVQRPLDTRKAQRIVERFNPAALGILTVSKRRDLSMVVLDGQTRLEAVRRLTDANGKLPCRIFTGLTLEQEAQMFLDLNTTTKPRLIDSYQVRVVAGDEIAKGINEIIRPYGWDIKNSPEKGYIQGIAAIEKIYRRSLAIEAEPNVLQMAIMMITKAWGLERDGVQASILLALGSLVAEYSSKIDTDRMVKTLAEWRGGPVGLITQGSAYASVQQIRKYNGIAALIVRTYNKGLTTRALPEWRFTV